MGRMYRVRDSGLSPGAHSTKSLVTQERDLAFLWRFLSYYYIVICRTSLRWHSPFGLLHGTRQRASQPKRTKVMARHRGFRLRGGTSWLLMDTLQNSYTDNDTYYFIFSNCSSRLLQRIPLERFCTAAKNHSLKGCPQQEDQPTATWQG